MSEPVRHGSGWRIRIQYKGLRESKTFPTKAECRAWRDDRLYELRHGRRKYNTRHLLSDALERYRDEVSPKKKGAKWERNRIDALLRLPIADKPLDEQTADDWGRYRDTRLRAVKSSTVNRDLNLVSAVFSTAIREWKWCNYNPISDVRRPANPPPRDRRISDDERDAICAHLTGSPARERARLMFLLALECAARLGELCGLGPDDVHADHIRVDGKTGPRSVPLTPRGRELVQELVGLPQIRSDYASMLFGRAVKAAGIKDLVFHDSRHEACYRLAQKLPNPMDLAKITGHSDLGTLMRVYYNPTVSELAERLR